MSVYELARKDLGVFSTLLGYVNSSHHLKWYKIMSDEKKGARLLLAPRNHAKTTCAQNALLWAIGRNPNIRIILVSNTFSLSAETLRVMKMRITTPEYRRIFPDIEPLEDWWNREEFTVKRSIIDRNPTAFAAGALGSIVSRRCDILFIDDLIDREITDSEAKNIQIRNFFEETLLPCLEPDGEIIVLGTRWGFDDFYSYLMTKEMFKDTTYTYRAIMKDTDGREKALWPERWPLEKLRKVRRNMPSSIFAQQFQNDPIDTEKAPFNEKWIRYYEYLPSNCRIYMSMDPAASSAPTSDYTSIIVLGAADDRYYVIDVYRDRIDFPEQIRKIKEYNERYHPLEIGIETNAYQTALSSFLRKYSLPIKEIKHAKVSKEMRIISLSPYIENGILLLRRNQPILVSEMLQYPHGKHDDLLDALEMALSLVAKKGGAYNAWLGKGMTLPI